LDEEGKWFSFDGTGDLTWFGHQLWPGINYGAIAGGGHDLIAPQLGNATDQNDKLVASRTDSQFLSGYAEAAANAELEQKYRNATKGGITSYWELKNYNFTQDDIPTFVVMVSKNVNNTTTTNADNLFDHNDSDNPFRLPEGRNNIFAISAAQAYFARPTQVENDLTGKVLANQLYPNGTYATLFSPYWQARLVDVPEAVALAMIGINPD